MTRKPKFKPVITRVKLNPEQAVLECVCYRGLWVGTLVYPSAGSYNVFERPGGNGCMAGARWEYSGAVQFAGFYNVTRPGSAAVS